jgi:type I restriction enzyme, S subunit
MSNGWPIKKLGDLSDLVTKGTTPTSIGYEFVQDGINFVKVESISTTGQFISDKLAHITPECHAALKRSQIEAGDILFSIAGALGRAVFATDDILPANTNQALAIIRLKQNNNVSRKFVLKALETGIVLEQIEKFKGGVAQQNLSLAQVRDFQIPIPPLPEQQRIVDILDNAFDGIATAKANAEKNLQNARALFESHLQSVFTQRGEGWVEKPLSKLSKINYGYTESASTENIGPKFLRITDIQNNRVDWSLVPYCPIKADDLPKYKLADGDIVFARTGATTGKSYLVDDPPEAVFASYLIRVQLSTLNYKYANVLYC